MANESSGRSTTVAARRRAMDRVRKRTQEREEKTGEAIVAAEGALEARAQAQAAARAADDEWRAEVGKLVALSWSLDEIAELVGVDVTEVRRARIPRSGGEQEEEAEPVAASSSTRAERAAAGQGRAARGRRPADSTGDPAAGGTSGVGVPVDGGDGAPVVKDEAPAGDPVPVG